MSPHARRLAVLVCPLTLLAACGPSGQQRTAQRLDERLLVGLGPDIAAGNAILQPLPDGARVALLGSSPYTADDRALDNQQRDVRAGVVEGLLDPRLMQIQVADTSALPDHEREVRIGNVGRYLEAYGLHATLQPAASQPPGPPGSVPAGLLITINVQCPDRPYRSGYGSGASMPVCD
ncbi:MAG TPA: hypothetical protein VGC09_21850 [Rhodopila sp.]